MILSRKKWIMIGVVVVVGALVAGIIPLSLLQLTVNTNGVGYYARGVRGGSNDNGGGDLLDTTSYVTSWTGGGSSEKIVIQGHYYGSGGLSPEMPREWYKVTLTVDNPAVQINGVTATTWTKTYENSGSGAIETGKWIPMEAVVLTLTNPCSGSVHVELWGHIHYYNPLPNGANFLLAEDYGYLRSGVGSVKVQNDVVEEGKNVNMFVETAYAHSDKSSVSPSDEGWFLNVYNPSGASVFSKTIGDNFAGTVSWLVPSGSYSASSTNIFKVILRNELIDQDDDWFFTVGPGMSTQVPGLPTFKVTSGDPPYHPGDQITVQISATKRLNPIAGFWVWVSYETSAGTTTNYIYEKKWYPATPTATGATASVTFTFPDAGNVRMEASSADTVNLNSGMAEMEWTVYGPSGTGSASVPFDWTQLAYVVVILIAALLVWWRAPIPTQFKMILMLILIAVAFYFAWPLMTTDYSTHTTWIPGE